MMSSQQHSAGTTIRIKLLATLSLAAFIPMMVLCASIASGLNHSWAMIVAVVFQIIGLVIAWFFGSGFVRQAGSMHDALQQINGGDFEARSDTVTDDELGASARALNTLCDNTLNLIQSNEERGQIQNSIENLISEMKEIAAGDLTISADVKEDMTGSIAKSVNHMTEQLRSIIKQVKTAAEHVNSYSSGMRTVSTMMSQDSDAHANLIHSASEQVLAMTDSFQNVATMTRESVQVAVETQQSATKGLKAVSDTVDGMHRIRNQVQSTSKRIKRLGESSQEIGEIVQLISDISDRTSILALNASIQASMAGDAGHGFAVVAEEIERLAERSTDATLQISKLIRAVQNETGEVISDMEESTREVVAGSQLATQAGETLFEIDSVAKQLVELIQSSSNYALQQAGKASNIAGSMSDISMSTKRSAEHSRESTRAVSLLDDMVGNLRNSVSQFKVSSDSDDRELAKPAPFSLADNVRSASAPVQPIVTVPADARQQPEQSQLRDLTHQTNTPGMRVETQTQSPVTISTAKPLENQIPNRSTQTRQPQPTLRSESDMANSSQNAPTVTKRTIGGTAQDQGGKIDENQLLQKVREAKAAYEKRKGGQQQANLDNKHADVAANQIPVSSTLVISGQNGNSQSAESQTQLTDEHLLRKAEGLLQELQDEKQAVAQPDKQPQTPGRVSRTVDIDDM